jgi:hypothetical protein
MWYYNNKEFEPDEEFLKDYVGFVYQITEKASNKKYIGKKFFWSTRRLPPLKGKKLRRKVVAESDWKDYFGSNGELKKLVEDRGEDAYHREILRLCKTKGECSYYEAKLQFEHDVLLKDEYFNEFIGCKIHSRHLVKNENL